MKPAAFAITFLLATTLATGQSFTGSLDSNDPNDVLIVEFTLSTPTSFHVQSWGYGGSSGAPGGKNAAGMVIAPGGFDPYVSLFSGAGPSATFLASNDDGSCSPGTPTAGSCPDPTLDVGSLPAGSYVLALSVFENLSFAENLGTGTLGDLFIGLGNYFDVVSGTVRTANYAFDIKANGLTVTSVTQTTVTSPPIISKAFANPTIPLNATTTLTLTILNPNLTFSLSGIGFTDPLPPGLVATSIGSGPGCGGTVTTTAGSISLTGGTLAPFSTCTITATIKGTIAGLWTNVTGNVTSKEGGQGNTASDSIIVVAPPVISKAFGSLSIPIGGTTTLSFTISNPNVLVGLTGVAFTDTLPPGLVVANPNGVTGSCGGGTITALPGSSTITLAGGNLAVADSCTFSVRVLGTREGVDTNLTSQVNSIEGGLGNTAAASIVVGTAFQIRYLSYLNAGDSFVNLTNGGINGGKDPAGDICANVYVFAEDQQLIECCTCPLTPNHLMTLSGQNDLINNTLTPGVAKGVTVGLMVTANPTGNAAACDASAVTAGTLTAGLRAYGTTLHALPGGSYGVTETAFSPAALSASELLKLDQFCGFIKANGSGHGICGACRPGAQGAKKQ